MLVWHSVHVPPCLQVVTLSAASACTVAHEGADLFLKSCTCTNALMAMYVHLLLMSVSRRRYENEVQLCRGSLEDAYVYVFLSSYMRVFLCVYVCLVRVRVRVCLCLCKFVCLCMCVREREREYSCS